MLPRIAMALLAAGLVLTGCTGTPEEIPATRVGSEILNPQAEELLPDGVRESGVLRVATDPSAPPFTSRDDAERIIGADIELAARIADSLGLELEVLPVPFNQLLPSVDNGAADIAISGLFILESRLAGMDFVTYLVGGTAWMVLADEQAEPFTPTTACGRRISVVANTFQADSYLPARSQQCRDAGDDAIQVVEMSTTSEGIESLLIGEVDGFVGDSPVIQAATEQSKGRLATVGSPSDLFEYGIAVSPNSPGLSAAIQAALTGLVADGSYGRLLGKWGIDEGAISVINVRTSRS
jgi:polar amino acid transport system substrate-binding protein